MTNYYLGIDTSCYTTSIAILDQEGNLSQDYRKLLTVKPGGRGLAQSEMVFQHTRNLPGLLEQAVAELPASYQFAGIGVSTQPRPSADSYMPAFLVGHNYARVLGTALKTPVHPISHQENHIYAGLWSSAGPLADDFLALHLSGGTTEIVLVRNSHMKPQLTILGESRDLHAGQFVDRVGVALGLAFPAGPHLEKLACTGREQASVIPVAVEGLQVSFSGPESHAQRLISKGEAASAVAAGVEKCIAESIVRLIGQAVTVTQLQQVLIVGGVTANLFIRSYLQEKLGKKQIQLYIPQPAYSSDNAVGAAYFALQQQ
ncbi:O-sialoglycoprotein endopeptidase [Anaerospora sp.]|jgi:N6-L-threonylcarbamoyladenine synthase|uniref:Kae1-like domain-containing protein n=1 Tax=Anaerospora sp. TaxID=1960278 RepID=UPI002898D656|nr:O-sialoglycoprotein endopeptidase [Anaerospora sp.]MDF2927845.1 tsaD 2 [Anaerospora sp.]